MLKLTRLICAAAFLSLIHSSPSLASDCNDEWVNIEAKNVAMFHGYSGTYLLVVNVGLWNEMPFTEKVGLMDAFNCAFAPSDDTPYVVEVISDMTNNRIGLWQNDTGLVVIER